MSPVVEGSARLNLKILNIYNRQTPMPPARFETTIQTNEQPQKYTLDIAVTGQRWK
jgi:hypothetical protein